MELEDLLQTYMSFVFSPMRVPEDTESPIIHHKPCLGPTVSRVCTGNFPCISSFNSQNILML